MKLLMKIFIFYIGFMLFAYNLLFGYGGEGPYEAPKPWTGWYWPTNDANNPNLYDAGGPLEKYDLFTGHTISQQWEFSNHFGGPMWYGHCHAGAVASYWEPEPKYGFNLNGITFRVGDLKGLLIEKYDDSWRYSIVVEPGGNYSEITPRAFWELLREWIKNRNKQLIMDLELGPEVWNYPIYKYKINCMPLNDGQDGHNCNATIWYAGYDSNLDFVGTKTLSKDYTFYCQIDNDGNIVGDCYWTGASENDHPDTIWRSETQAGGNPYVDYSKVQQLIASAPVVKQVEIYQDGKLKYKAHWTWDATTQSRKLTIDRNSTVGAGYIDVKIRFSRTMSTAAVWLVTKSGAIVNVLRNISWSKTNFDNDTYKATSDEIKCLPGFFGIANLYVSGIDKLIRALDGNPKTFKENYVNEEIPPDTTYKFKIADFPKVVSASPTGNGISVCEPIKIVFDKKMDRASLIASLYVKTDGEEALLTYEFPDDYTIVATPIAPHWKYNSTYLVKLLAQNDPATPMFEGAKDIDDNPLDGKGVCKPSDYTFSFTTQKPTARVEILNPVGTLLPGQTYTHTAIIKN